MKTEIFLAKKKRKKKTEISFPEIMNRVVSRYCLCPGRFFCQRMAAIAVELVGSAFR